MSKPQGLIQRALKIDPVLNVAGNSANATDDQRQIIERIKTVGDWLSVWNTVANEVNSIVLGAPLKI